MTDETAPLAQPKPRGASPAESTPPEPVAAVPSETAGTASTQRVSARPSQPAQPTASSSTEHRASSSTHASADAHPAPEPIKAVPLRHPGRWLAVAVLAVLAAMFVHLLVTNDAFQWSFMVDNMFRPPVLEGVRGTVLMTLAAMALGVGGGVVVAVMRLSPNPVLKTVAWLYTWFFRAVPRLVLLATFGGLGILWSRVEFGVPFDTEIGKLFGVEDLRLRFWGISTRDLFVGFVVGLVALGLSEAAYMAEIVRAGIQSVDHGQSEAAAALGMTRGQILRRIVLPQAMRMIIPPTGNETIAMLKDTSLLIYVPVTAELFFRLDGIGKGTFQVFPMYVAATIWYLVLTSILLIGQYYLERYFSRGYGQRQRARMRLRGLRAEQGSTPRAATDEAADLGRANLGGAAP